MENLNRKLKLLETDLDTAEDKAADANDKFKEKEAQAEDLERENKQFKRRIDMLEGNACELRMLCCQCGGVASESA